MSPRSGRTSLRAKPVLALLQQASPGTRQGRSCQARTSPWQASAWSPARSHEQEGEAGSEEDYLAQSAGQ